MTILMTRNKIAGSRSLVVNKAMIEKKAAIIAM